jgi:ABC-type phosphate transport system substrate-binding protein
MIQGMDTTPAQKVILTTAGLLAIIGLAGCGGSPQPAAVTHETTGPAASAVQPPAATVATPTPTASPIHQLGEKVTFPDGVALTVSYANTVQAGQYDYGAAADGTISLFTITVTNNGTKEFDGSTFMGAQVTYGPQGLPAQDAVTEGVKGNLATIDPGGTQTISVGYGIPAAAGTTVRFQFMDPISPVMGDPVIIKGTIR